MNINKIARDYVVSMQGKPDVDMEHEYANFLSWLINNRIVADE